MNTVKINAYCPECGYQVDDATGVGDAREERPKVDAIAICIRCAGIGIYTMNPDGDSLGLRLPTVTEKVGLSEDEEIRQTRELIQRMNVKGWFDE